MSFELHRTDYLPGYTGHIPHNYYEEVAAPEPSAPHSQVPGYGGYIPAVQAENLYGTTYGKITLASASGTYPKGRDPTAAQKFKSDYQVEYVDLRTVQEKKAVEVLGVARQQDLPRTVVPVEVANSFWGVEDQEASLKANTKAFYANPGLGENEAGERQNPEAAKSLFYGQNPNPTEPMRRGEPLPGYTGFSRKVTSCNIFGLTYAQARKTAAEKLQEEQQERAEVLKTRANFVPDYLK